jgi:fructose-1,6-bisphosphatase/inositol monophosphatase family enzyme
MTENPNELLRWAEALARDAGAIMREYFALSDKQIETKSDNTPVTIADKKINDLLIERVAKDFPEHGVLAEEGSANADRQKLWVCDPIDGTQGFILGVPTAMFSLAFVVDGVPLAAVMYEPLLDKMYTALKGEGAFLNGAPTRVSAQNSLQNARIGITGGAKQVLKHESFFSEINAAGVESVFVYGNVFKGSLVACGRIDGFVFPGRSAHDIAAEKLVIEEAGGKVTDLDGNEQRYDGKIRGAIVSNGLVHDELVKLLATEGVEGYLGY